MRQKPEEAMDLRATAAAAEDLQQLAVRLVDLSRREHSCQRIEPARAAMKAERQQMLDESLGRKPVGRAVQLAEGDGDGRRADAKEIRFGAES